MRSVATYFVLTKWSLDLETKNRCIYKGQRLKMCLETGDGSGTFLKPLELKLRLVWGD